MDARNADLYIHIIPLKNADNKKILQNKNNPLQRIKVSRMTMLSNVSNYIHRLATNETRANTRVALFCTQNNECMGLPLSLKIEELFVIMDQYKEIEIRYTFQPIEDKKITDIPVPIITIKKNSTQSISGQEVLPNKFRYAKSNIVQSPTQIPEETTEIHKSDVAQLNFPPAPPPNHMPQPNNIQPLPSINTLGPDPLGSLFHSGLSMFSNSFGMFPMDSQPFSVYSNAPQTNEKPQTDESVSLRKDLEQILRK